MFVGRVVVIDRPDRCGFEVVFREADAQCLVPVEVVEVAGVLGLADEVEPLGTVLVVDDGPVRRVFADGRADTEAARQE